MTSIQPEIVLASGVAGLLVIALALFVRARASALKPGAAQMLWEWTIASADGLNQSSQTAYRRRATAVAVTLFWFILAANWLPLLPSSPLVAPTSNINLTLALGIVVIATVHVTAIQARGLRGYLRHYLSPMWLAPVRLIEELLKPLTLALRLFGVIFASALMAMLLVELLPAPVAVLPHAVWNLFDVVMGVIQAFIFALLTLLYFDAALPAASTAKEQNNG
jgi:F-type H+-transporting ATPase subunit a